MHQVVPKSIEKHFFLALKIVSFIYTSANFKDPIIVIQMNHTEQPTPESIKSTAHDIFNSAWSSLTNHSFPSKILWLNGAPGSGKGTQTQWIQKVANIDSEPVIMSNLLQSPEAKRIKDSGQLVGDKEVTSILFAELTKEQYKNGAIVDGYPRTLAQSEIVKLLASNLKNQSRFEVIILDVDQKTSIERQLHRGKLASDKEEVRETDKSEEAAKTRYNVFKEQSYKALLSLDSVFPLHLINANSTIETVKNSIKDKLK